MGAVHHCTRWTLSKSANDVDAVIERLRELRKDLQDNPDAWQNHTLSDYLESVAAWLEDTKGRAPAEPSWDFVAGLFGVGKIYE
jgi:hypothetical protein